MFGPNQQHSINLTSSYSHRDVQFINLYSKIKKELSDKFDLGNYEIVLIPGSATIGVEAAITSMRPPVEVLANSGKFSKRWEDIASRASLGLENKDSRSLVSMSCLLETSNSTLYPSAEILDCVSSFPYYKIPKECKVFITCCNKQIGSIPGVSIVGIKYGCESMLLDDSRFSMLNLKRHLEFSRKGQTLTTASTIVFEDMLEKIKNFNLEECNTRINKNCDILKKYFGYNIIGETQCPVITVNKKFVPLEVARKWQLYGVNSDSDVYQFFTYSGSEDEYLQLIAELESCGVP